MAESIVVRDTVRIPPRALTLRAVRASGPGGQNVNKVASKVALHVDIDAVEGMPEAARARLRALAGRRLDARGRLVVTSQATRDRARNLEDARDRVRRLVEQALVEPVVRHRPRPPAAARERRLEGKRRRAGVKRLRERPAPGD